LYSIIYSLVTFPLTPKYMTLNDLEILNDHFTLNFRYYEQLAFQQLGHICTVESARGQRRCAEADRVPKNIWNPRKKCGSFKTLHRRNLNK